MKKGEMPEISACVMWTPPCFTPNSYSTELSKSLNIAVI
jgi:hypothetical protein